MICSQRCAAGRGLPVGVGDRAGLGLGMQAGAEQGLADIDVAEAGDEALVEQGRFQRRELAPRRAWASVSPESSLPSGSMPIAAKWDVASAGTRAHP
jgi:hypothetical protein